MERIKALFLTVFGSGYLPGAPGTYGAMVGVFIWYLLSIPLAGINFYLSFGILAVLIAIVSYLGAIWAYEFEPKWGEDPSKIVVDEVVGVWLALLGHATDWQTLLIGFALFRLFDIWKPLGIRQLEKVGKGWGVMLDDLLAGVYANIVLWGIFFIRNHFGF